MKLKPKIIKNQVGFIIADRQGQIVGRTFRANDRMCWMSFLDLANCSQQEAIRSGYQAVKVLIKEIQNDKPLGTHPPKTI